MGTDLKSKFKYSTTLVFLSIIALISGLYGILDIYSGLIALPVAAAFLASVFTLENKKRISSFVVPSILMLAEICVLYSGGFSVTAVFSITAAIIISVWYAKGYRKSEAALIITVLITVFIALLFVISVYNSSGSYAYEDLINRLEEIFENFKSMARESLTSVQQGNGRKNELLNDEYITELFTLVYRSIPALIAIFAFGICGFCFKIFSAILLRYSDNERKIMSWRFITTPVFAYFYVCLIVSALFIESADSIFAISVMNLQMIFMIVFAYVGYTFSSALITIRSQRPAYSNLLFVAAILIFSSFALRILAIIGAFVTIMHGKISSGSSNPLFNNDKF